MSEKLWLMSQAVSTVLLPRLSQLSSDEHKRKTLKPLIPRWVGELNPIAYGMMKKMDTIYYLGVLGSGQRGAIGTHTAGIISGFQANDIRVVGLFLSNAVPSHSCDEVILLEPTQMHWAFINKFGDRLKLAMAARKLPKNAKKYHRFDPLLSPFVVDGLTVLEYNDDTVEQVRFAAKKAVWGFWGQLIRLAIYPSLFRFSEQISFTKSKVVVCVTSGLECLVKKIQPKANTVVVQNGSSAILQEKELPYLNNCDEKIKIAHVGTLTYWDGLLELLDAVALFLEIEGENSIEMRIIGSGSAFYDITSRIRELGLQGVVQLEPPVNREEAIKILHGVDVVPLLKTISSYGLSPIKFYEARALGCYLICSNIAHINEISVEEGVVVSYPLVTEEIIEALVFVRRHLESIRADRASRSRSAQDFLSWQARVSQLMGEIK